MDFSLQMSYVLELNTHELRLISKALRGALLDADDQRDALDLQRRLVMSKHARLKQALTESSKAVDNIEAAERERSVNTETDRDKP